MRSSIRELKTSELTMGELKFRFELDVNDRRLGDWRRIP